MAEKNAGVSDLSAEECGIGQCDLVRIYISVIRPVGEYACPAWHTNLPKYLSDTIELIQKR